MAIIDSGIGSSFLTFRFLGDNGVVMASFDMNPADVKMVQRCQEISPYFESIGKQIPEAATLENVLKLNADLEDKICQLLGYDAKQSLFGRISATSIMSDGRMFIVHVMDRILEYVGPEINKRKQAMESAVSKHTAKYAT